MKLSMPRFLALIFAVFALAFPSNGCSTGSVTIVISTCICEGGQIYRGHCQGNSGLCETFFDVCEKDCEFINAQECDLANGTGVTSDAIRTGCQAFSKGPGRSAGREFQPIPSQQAFEKWLSSKLEIVREA